MENYITSYAYIRKNNSDKTLGILLSKLGKSHYAKNLSLTSRCRLIFYNYKLLFLVKLLVSSIIVLRTIM